MATKTKFATADAVKKAAKTMPDEHVHCRTLGHVYATRKVEPIKNGGYFEVVQCVTCTFSKETTYDRYGYMTGQKTFYPDGYLLKGLGRLRTDTRAVLKVDSLKRYLKESNGHA